eukprot:TRINITY_DN57380_c0_g1_i1.p1 TRINITY_DN57380_c0_g1~~TRINITY_DN57380_c0_g1_i1.p1  ORF type:complete len:868 (-),score=74.38 TRINITY_DN57380_c0_g1_i1:77-2344(-)
MQGRHSAGNDIIPAGYVLYLVKRVKVLLETRNSAVYDVTVAEGETMHVVGDVHGHLDDVVHLFTKYGYPSATTRYLFNGDVPDRGPYGVEIFCLLFCCMLVEPKSLSINRGNHEDFMVNRAYGFEQELYEKYGEHGEAILTEFVSFYAGLPLVSILNSQVMVVHGGLPRYQSITLQHIRDLDNRKGVPVDGTTMFDHVFVDLLWADPDKTMSGIQPNRMRGTSVRFGADITMSWAHRNHLRLIVRSHDVPDSGAGWEIIHNGWMLTVFSASQYRPGQHNKCGVVKFNLKDGGPTLACHAYEHDWLEDPPKPPPRTDKGKAPSHSHSSSHPHTSHVHTRQHAIKDPTEAVLRQVGQRVPACRDDLFAFYRPFDRQQTGKVSPSIFYQGIRDVLQVNFTEEDLENILFDKSLPAHSEVDYLKFINRFQVVHKNKGVESTLGGALEKALYKAIMQANMSIQEVQKTFGSDGEQLTDHQLAQRLFEHCPSLKSQITQPQLIQVIRHVQNGGTQSGAHNEAISGEQFIKSLMIMFYQPYDLTPALKDLLTNVCQLLQTYKGDIIELFRRVDTNGDGFVGYQEFVAAIQLMQSGTGLKVSGEEELASLARAVDSNQDGGINFMEFCQAFFTARCKPVVSRLVHQLVAAMYRSMFSMQQAFEYFDSNKDGKIDIDALGHGIRALGLGMSDGQIQTIVEFLDSDGNGYVDYHEFCAAFELVDQQKREKEKERRSSSNSPTPTNKPSTSSGHHHKEHRHHHKPK